MVDKATADRWAFEDIERRTLTGDIKAELHYPADRVPPPLKGATRPIEIPGRIRSIETAENLLGPVTEARKAQAEAKRWENACQWHYRRAEDFRKKLNQAEHDRDTAQSERGQHWQEKRDALAEADEAIREHDELRATIFGYETALRYFRDIAPRPLAKMIAGVLTGGALR